MTGSWIGRSLLAVPVLSGSVGVGLVVAGVTGRVATGALVTLVLAVVGTCRVAVTGVTIDLEREEVRVRTFWRTHRLDADALARVEAAHRADGATESVRFLLRDGRTRSSAALAYLATRAAERFVADLATLAEGRPIDVALTRNSFRRVA